jgi:hypothetical protein
MTDPSARADERTHDLATEMLGEVMGEIDRADQKASLLIGSLGIAFSIVLSGILGGDWSLSSLNPLGAVLWGGGALAASASVVAAAMAVWPRLSKGPGPGAITYWGQVRGLASPAAVAEALAQRGLLPPERTYQQLLVLSSVVQRKYRCIRWSMGLAGVGIALVGVSFFFVL